MENQCAATPRWADARTTAAHIGLALPTLWRAVRNGHLPPPSYPTPGAPRWDLTALDAHLTSARKSPADNLAEQRVRRLNRLAAQAAE